MYCVCRFSCDCGFGVWNSFLEENFVTAASSVELLSFRIVRPFSVSKFFCMIVSIREIITEQFFFVVVPC